MSAHVQHGLGGPHPDDEDRQMQYTRETDDQEQREINRRVRWSQEQRAAERIRNAEKEQA